MIVLLAFFIFILWSIYDHWHIKRLYEGCSSLPLLPASSLPFVGQTPHFLFGKDELFRTFAKFANGNGGVARFWYGRRICLLLTDAETIDFVLKTCLEKDYIMDVLKDFTCTGSIFESVSVWRPRRKLIAPAFSLKVLKPYVEIFNRGAKELVTNLSDVADEQTVSVWKYVTAYAMDAVTETNLGVKVGAQENPDQVFFKIMEEVLNCIRVRVVQPWLQIRVLFNMLPRSKIFERNKRIARQFIRQFIEAKKRKTEDEYLNNSDPADKDDITKKTSMRSFLNLIMEPPCQLSDTDLEDECLVVAIAGSDTSAVAICFTLCLLARHPEIQEKVYNELCEVFQDKEAPVTNRELQKLQFTEAVIKEALRLYPPVPVIMRRADQHITLPTGQTIVPNTAFLIHIWGIHRNPKYWGPDFDSFRPERFLEPEHIQPCSYIPFSLGPRNCLGYQYAMMSVKSVISTVLRYYEVLPHVPLEKVKNDTYFDVRFDIMLKDDDNFKIKLKTRNVGAMEN